MLNEAGNEDSIEIIDQPDNSHIEKPKPWYEATLLRIGALITATLVIFNFTKDHVVLFVGTIDLNSVTLILVSINFLALMAFCLFAIKVPELKFNSNPEVGIKKYSELLNIVYDSDSKDIPLGQHNIIRVNLLVKQLNNNIIFYALTLLIVYLIYILQQTGNMPDLIKPFAKSITDIFNFLSSLFIYLGFKVLYNKTLDDNNNRIIYYMDGLFLSFFYILIYVMLFNNHNTHDNYHKIVVNNLSLISGIFNGLAMSLLFSRFVSMEHIFTGLFDKNNAAPIIKNQKIFYYGTIFVLPLYALVQPLFGDFQISEFGNPVIFANIVFLVCFVGKLFFLLLFYVYLSKKLIHLYIHLVISKYGVPKNFINCFQYPDS